LFGQENSGEFVNRLLIVILAICSVPLYAQGAQPDAADLKAEARNAVGTIGADKHKTQTYCEILDLERQLADQEENNTKKKNRKKDKDKDNKKAEALSQKINQLQKQVGPEFVTLDNILKRLDLTSPDGREIALIIQSLNQTCPY
jgi:oligoendopeptidase F